LRGSRVSLVLRASGVELGGDLMVRVGENARLCMDVDVRRVLGTCGKPPHVVTRL